MSVVRLSRSSATSSSAWSASMPLSIPATLLASCTQATSAFGAPTPVGPPWCQAMIDAISAGRPQRSASSAPHWAWSMPKRSRSARTRSAPAGNSRARASQASSPKTSGRTSLPTSCSRPARWTVSPGTRASSAAPAAPIATEIACRCSWPHEARPLPLERSRKRKVAASSARRRSARRPTSMTAWRIVLARIGCARAAEFEKRRRFAAKVASCSRASTRSAAVDSSSSQSAMTRSTVASRTGNSASSSMAPATDWAATGSMPSFQGAQSVACFASMALSGIDRGCSALRWGCGRWTFVGVVSAGCPSLSEPVRSVKRPAGSRSRSTRPRTPSPRSAATPTTSSATASSARRACRSRSCTTTLTACARR